MLEVQPKDSRGYFTLPQRPEDAGYYVYGTPGGGAGQYAHPALLSLLFFVEREWQAIDDRKFGIGNISLAGGGNFADHDSHKDGLQVDVHPVRIDGAKIAVTYFDSDYDRVATEKLIGFFSSHPFVKSVLFNDPAISGTRRAFGHDNHFHVNVRAVVE